MGAAAEKTPILPAIPRLIHSKNPSHKDPYVIEMPDSERKYVTILFSDVSGYSTICEKIDPEDVQDLMTLLFSEIVKILMEYEGYVERIIGDEVMAVFGMPVVHEDDAVRAVKAAIDIHRLVDSMSHRLYRKLGRSLAMHSGISSGLVVTGNVDTKKRRHGIIGDTLNHASYLTKLAGAGEIFVGRETFNASSGFIRYKKMFYEGTGSDASPFIVYKVLESWDNPQKIRRLHGAKSKLIGRDAQLKKMADALDDLKAGRGSIHSIIGEAGTGKSRLISEFRYLSKTLNIEWLEGQAFSYTSGIPYFPIKDLLGRSIGIKANDTPVVIQSKITENLSEFLVKPEKIASFVSSLYGVPSKDIQDMTPESWKLKVMEAIIHLLSEMSGQTDIVICLEDVHWMDPSTLELLMFFLETTNLPIMFICSIRAEEIQNVTYLPPVSPYSFSKIELDALSSTQSIEMVASLLNTSQIPESLERFITDNMNGNPFYIEEVVNALIESRLLVKRGDAWITDGDVEKAALPSSIFGLISDRFGRLDKTAKIISQEASVIGRSFAYDLLKRITHTPALLDHSLEQLQKLDLIYLVKDEPEVIYAFKHGILHDVVYNGILLKERRVVHEKIACILEKSARDMLEGIYDTLAFHFSMGKSWRKAVQYLVKSGQKSLKQNSLEEAHGYYQRAYDLFKNSENRLQTEKELLADLLIKWFFVFNARGYFNELLSLLEENEEIINTIEDKHYMGMFYVCKGWVHQRKEQVKEAYDYLSKAIAIGEETMDRMVTSYARTFMIWVCTDMGRLDDAITFMKKVHADPPLISGNRSGWRPEADLTLARFNLTGPTITYWFMGNCRQCNRLGNLLLTQGEKNRDISSSVEGYQGLGMACLASGDYLKAAENFKKAVQKAANPVHAYGSKFLLGYAYLATGNALKARKIIDEMLALSTTKGNDYIGNTARGLMGLINFVEGNLSEGMKQVLHYRNDVGKRGKVYHQVSSEFYLGRIYLELFMKDEKVNRPALLKNIVFFALHLPFAKKRAESHLLKAFEMADRINAKGIKGQAGFELFRLYLAKGNKGRAKTWLLKSIDQFKICNADVHLATARKALADLES